MNIRPLVIDNVAKKAIYDVCEHAYANRFSKEDMERLIEGKISIGDDPKFACELKFGYRCVFSLEEQPIGECRHLSISVDSKDKYPNIEAVKVLLKEFGFKYPLEDKNHCHVYLEEEIRAVNIISPIY